MVAISSLTPVFIWLKQKPKKGSKKHVLIFDPIDLENFKKSEVGIHPYYSAKGKLVGYATRKSLRKLSLVSRASHIFVFNTNGELFLQRRASTKDVFPNLIAPSASGHVDLNETSRRAAIRELKEELGINKKPVFLGTVICFTSQLKEFIDVFILITDAQIKINKDEISEGFFVPFNQIYEKPLFLECIPAMQKELTKFKIKIIKQLFSSHHKNSQNYY